MKSMRTEEKIINIIFDPGKGKVSISGREGVCGEPFGELPTPVRRGYRFDGWYLGEERITSDTVVDSEEDLRPVARWIREERGAATRGKRSSLKRQKIALVALAAAVVVLAVVLAVVLELITIYSLTDVYVKDDVEYSDTYTIKRQDGVYMLFDKDGVLMDTNGEDENVFIAKGSGNQYKIDAETGDYSLVARVDTEDYEDVPGTRLLMYAQIASEDLYSIKVTRSDGSGYTFINDGKKVYIDGFKNATVQYDQDLYAQLASACGYTLTVMKLDSKSEDSTVPRLPGTDEIDYSVYGLDQPVATFTITAAKDPDASSFEPDPDRTYTVLIGDKTLAATGYYVKLADTKSIYILTSDRIDATVMQPIENLVTPRVSLPVDLNSHPMAKDFYLSHLEAWTGEDDIEGDPIVAFDYEELDYRINTMMQNYPYICDSDLLEGMDGYTINDTKASEVLTLFYEMTPNACVKLGITREALEEYHLLENVHYLTYRTKTGEYDEDGNELYGINRMLISEKTEDGVYYVASFLYDMIVEVDQYYFSFLEWDDIDWYNQYFMSMNIVYAQKINFQFGDKEYNFILDNSLSYAYYLVRSSAESKVEMKFVDLKEGIVYENEEGVLCYKKNSNGKIYSPVKLIDFDSAKLVSYETALKKPSLTNVLYVQDVYYYINENKQSVRVNPDYTTDRIEVRDGEYYYVYTLSSGETKEIKVNKTTGDLIYRESYRKLEVDANGDGVIEKSEIEYYHVETTFQTDASNLQILCDQFTGGEGDNPKLLDYTIVDSGLNDSGINESETVTATDNFRKLHMQMLMFSLDGDVDEEEFERSKGMTVEEFLASDLAVPAATVTTLCEDYAKLLNNAKKNVDGKLVPVYTENIEKCLVFRFYQYTDWKSLVTIEALVKDENGNWVSSGDELAGRFYVNSSILDKMESDIEKILNKELIDYTTKY
ncbi:MAG: DUF4340 domain-containing protein [Clostridia bacterium]|nr:DUF4340 domain-containing protein [Clostridia bacterium]